MEYFTNLRYDLMHHGLARNIYYSKSNVFYVRLLYSVILDDQTSEISNAEVDGNDDVYS